MRLYGIRRDAICANFEVRGFIKKKKKTSRHLRLHSPDPLQGLDFQKYFLIWLIYKSSLQKSVCRISALFVKRFERCIDPVSQSVSKSHMFRLLIQKTTINTIISKPKNNFKNSAEISKQENSALLRKFKDERLIISKFLHSILIHHYLHTVNSQKLHMSTRLAIFMLPAHPN